MRSAVALLDVPVTQPVPSRPARRRSWRRVGHRAAWLLLSGWIVLPLLPALGLGLSVFLGLSLF